MDTRDRRASAIHVSMPWRGLLPEPGTLDAADRKQVAFLYRTADAPAGNVFTEVLTDTFDVNDAFIRYLFRNRQGTEIVSILDDEGVFREHLITGSEALTLADASVQWNRRVRRGDEAITVTDGFVQWRRLQRLIEENVDLIDGFSVAIAGAGIVYARVLSDVITMIDDTGQRWMLRTSQLTDTLATADSIFYWLRRIRELGDDIEFADGELRIRESVRALDDNITLDDQIIGVYQAAETYDVRLRFGSEHGPILGSNSVGMPIIGGY